MEVEPMSFKAMHFTPVGAVYTIGHVKFTDDEGTTQTLVEIVFSSPDTRYAIFFDAESAEKLADDIRGHAQQARTGIEVARDISALNGQDTPSAGIQGLPRTGM